MWVNGLCTQTRVTPSSTSICLRAKTSRYQPPLGSHHRQRSTVFSTVNIFRPSWRTGTPASPRPMTATVSSRRLLRQHLWQLQSTIDPGSVVQRCFVCSRRWAIGMRTSLHNLIGLISLRLIYVRTSRRIDAALRSFGIGDDKHRSCYR